MTKVLMNKLKEILPWDPTDSWNHNISVSLRFDLANIFLRIVQFFPNPVGWTTKTTLRGKIVLGTVGKSIRTTLKFHKIKTFKKFRRNLLKTNITFKVTSWDGIVRVTCTIINWSHWIYNGKWGKLYKTYSSPRCPHFIHVLSFESTTKLCINFLNQLSVYFHI